MKYFDSLGSSFKVLQFELDMGKDSAKICTTNLDNNLCINVEYVDFLKPGKGIKNAKRNEQEMELIKQMRGFFIDLYRQYEYDGVTQLSIGKLSKILNIPYNTAKRYQQSIGDTVKRLMENDHG